MADFDLDKFLQTYKPKKIEDSLEPYLKLPKLKGFTLLKHNSKNTVALEQLLPGKTYIKYIKHADACKDKHYKDHIKSGMLVAGGYFHKGEFVKSADQTEWTHIVLKYVVNTQPDETDETDQSHRSVDKVFTVSLRTNYIFYVTHKTDNDQFRGFLVELI